MAGRNERSLLEKQYPSYQLKILKEKIRIYIINLSEVIIIML